MTEKQTTNCPECNYSATPDEVLGQERKHFFPHSLRCVRCGYTTETKGNWAMAISAWNKKFHDRNTPKLTDPAQQQIGR